MEHLHNVVFPHWREPVSAALVEQGFMTWPVFLSLVLLDQVISPKLTDKVASSAWLPIAQQIVQIFFCLTYCLFFLVGVHHMANGGYNFIDNPLRKIESSWVNNSSPFF